MRLGFLVVKDMRTLPFEQVARWAAENGFPAIDTGLENAEICRRYGLELASFNLGVDPVVPDETGRMQAQSAAVALLDQAAALGVKRSMITHTRLQGVPVEETLRLFSVGYGPIVERAEGLGIKLYMEPYHAHGRWLATTPETIRATLAALPSPALGISMDPSHFIVQGIDPIRATLEFGEHIVYVHAKDTEILRDRLYEVGLFGQALNNPSGRPFAGWWRYRLPGYGELNWPRFMGALAEIGYDDVVAIEHEDALFYGSPERNQKGLLLAKQFLAPFIV